MDTQVTSLAIIYFFLLVFSIVSSITVYPGEEIEGNCPRKSLDFFLCYCISSNTTLFLSPGNYTLQRQDFCRVADKSNVAIVGMGDSPEKTIIRCNSSHSFNVIFTNMQNLTIKNVIFLGCGGIIDERINRTFISLLPVSYFGRGSRFTLMLYNSSNVTLDNLIARNNLGYTAVTWNVHGAVRLSHLRIEDTTFENDPRCVNYDYTKDGADFTCSGSGLLVLFTDFPGFNKNSDFKMNDCVFRNNKNIVPPVELQILSDLIDTAYFHGPIPAVGAGCIALYYLQSNFEVATEVSNTIFYNNNGSYSGTVSITTVRTISSRTRFENCLFDDNNRVIPSFSEDTFISINRRGGIVFHYLVIRGGINLPDLPITVSTDVEMLTVLNCNFTRLGGTRGAAMHVEKISPDYITIVVRIEQCNFVENEADAGSAIYTQLSEFRVSLESEVSGGIQFDIVDINAIDNKLSPGAILNYGTSRVVTGVFSFENCQAFFKCNQQCNFTGNQPSVIYGHNSGIIMSGRAVFKHNEAKYGGALRLLDTVVYVNIGSVLWFEHNFATTAGGAIDILFSNTNVQTEDICPIQFIGDSSAIFSLDDIRHLNVSIGFANNYAVTQTSLQSIFANVFYVCSWYPDTLTQINLGIHTPVAEDTRVSVYRNMFDFYPVGSVDDHLFILAYIPCLCDENFDYNISACLKNEQLYLDKPIVPGRSFNISIVSLDVVGSMGHSRTLYGRVYHTSVVDGQLILGDGQDVRPFSVVNKTCTNADFVVYGRYPKIPNSGILEISLSDQQYSLRINFNFSTCSVGFKLFPFNNESFGCICDEFFAARTDGRFQCDATTGNIIRRRSQAWLSVIDGDLQYVRMCAPTYCHNKLLTFDLNEEDVLCTNHHSGRVCGGCEDGFSRVFGSDTCKKCDNAWLATIVLYTILGIALVLILFALKFTVTLGMINGLIFFCNVMSINEQLFFNTQISSFSFLRVFISLINLDLGFEICFYDGMSQLAKTGLQFVFPVYLWLLMLIIIYMGKFYVRARKLSSHSALPVLATLILLSYSKLLRTTISVFAFETMSSSEHGSIYVWQPDPNVEYFTDGHIVLFVIAVFFLLVFIIPFVICFTFPSLVLRSKRLSYFFPILDCYFAPYKVKYRYWFGLRALLLLYISGMEAIIFSYREALLLSSIAVIGFYTIVQASFHPFKGRLTNTLDIVFMGIFLLIATITLYLYPSTDSFDKVNIVVKVLGYLSFAFFCILVAYHVYHTTRHTHWNIYLTDMFQKKMKKHSEKLDFLTSTAASDRAELYHYNSSHTYIELETLPKSERFRETLLEEL